MDCILFLQKINREKTLIFFLFFFFLSIDQAVSSDHTNADRRTQLLEQSRLRRAAKQQQPKSHCDFSPMANKLTNILSKIITPITSELEKAIASGNKNEFEKIAKKYSAQIFREIQKLDQADLRNILEKNLADQIAELGYPVGLKPSLVLSQIDDFILDFIRKTPENAYANAWGNNMVEASVFDMLLRDLKVEDLPTKLSPLLDNATKIATWEQCRRLIMNGEWKEFRTPELAEAYQKTMSDPAFLKDNALSRRNIDQRVFPKD